MAGLLGRYRDTAVNRNPPQENAMRGQYQGELADIVHQADLFSPLFRRDNHDARS
jgi:hypothetical protein